MSLLTRIDAEMNNIITNLEQRPKSFPRMSSENQSSFVHSISPENNPNSLKQNSSLLLENNYDHVITAETFPFTHLYNRDIRDLPLSKGYNVDFDCLRSCSIFTMTDLIGRYLIHRTPQEFCQFLIEKVRCSETFTDEMVQLISRWTSHNLQIGRGTRTTILKQYL